MRGQKKGFRHSEKTKQQIRNSWSPEKLAEFGEYKRKYFIQHPVSVTTRKKISKAGKNRIVSEETRQRLKVVNAGLWTLEMRRQVSNSLKETLAKLSPEQMVERLAPFVVKAHLTRMKQNVLEMGVGKCLRGLGVVFKAQQPFLGKRLCVVDFYLPEYKVAIECDETSHHSTKREKQKDAARAKFLLKHHKVRVVRVLEKEIKADTKRAVCKALAKIGVCL